MTMNIQFKNMDQETVNALADVMYRTMEKLSKFSAQDVRSEQYINSVGKIKSVLDDIEKQTGLKPIKKQAKAEPIDMNEAIRRAAGKSQ